MLSYVIYFQITSFVITTCVLPLSNKEISFKKQLGIIKIKYLNNTILTRSCHQLRASVWKTSPTFNSYDKIAFNPVTGLEASNMTITWVSWATIKKQPCGERKVLILTRKISGSPSVPEATRTCKNTPQELQGPAGRSAQGKAQPRAKPSPALPRAAPLSLQRGARKGRQTLTECRGEARVRRGRPSPTAALLRDPSAGTRVPQPTPPPACDSSPSVKGVGREAGLHGRAELVALPRPRLRETSSGQHPGVSARCCLTAKWRHRSRKWRSAALGEQQRPPLVCFGGRQGAGGAPRGASRCRTVTGRSRAAGPACAWPRSPPSPRAQRPAPAPALVRSKPLSAPSSESWKRAGW